jgi:transcriptional regulator with XRE-family HTH domain
MNTENALKNNDNGGNFSMRLRSLRKQKNLSQTELGKIVKLHYTHIGRYERGLSLPGSETLQRLADALGVSGDFLIKGTVEEAARANFEDRELLKKFQLVEMLSVQDKDAIKLFLDAFLAKKQLEKIISNTQ